MCIIALSFVLEYSIFTTTNQLSPTMAKKKIIRSAEDILSAKETLKMHGTDVGSSQVQIAGITSRIVHLTQHLATNRNDKHSRRGLIGLVSKRRKLLKYLKRTNAEVHAQTLAELGLRK